jgi:hypothetical protein
VRARPQIDFRYSTTRRHNRRLNRVVASVLRDNAEIEDAIQQAYVSAFLKLDPFASRSSFATRLTRLAPRAKRSSPWEARGARGLIASTLAQIDRARAQ